MAVTLIIPDELERRLTDVVTEAERKDFVLSAIADKLELRELEAEARFADVLLAEHDPEADPEREEAECRAAVEEGFADIDARRNLLTVEDVRRRMDSERAKTRPTSRT